MNIKHIITAEDIRKGDILQEDERIYPVNKENLFRATIYSILSAQQDFPTHQKIYHMLLDQRLDTPNEILEHQDRLDSIVRHAFGGPKKKKYIIETAKLWPGSTLPAAIVEDVTKNNFRDGYMLRNMLAEEFPGLGYKCASLDMTSCGYTDIGIIDKHTIQFLHDNEFPIKAYYAPSRLKKDPGAINEFHKDSGPSKKEYLLYEQMLKELAHKAGVSLVRFRNAIYVKYSTWTSQTELFLPASTHKQKV